ncbi:hypothetical protein KGQ19_42310 [Catenulispora sp. NL8]|uniref:Uncharacterized protein n=1 Tax=Catenulispora pinistramenti TaxID=2705254 RepID=A0ABS5L576_9ACTN|nr:hypothetical protein [Catenulispora pinistramenti]MBS2553508.1 hypothetical protein [Catenulispora pinistramenti]
MLAGATGRDVCRVDEGKSGGGSAADDNGAAGGADEGDGAEERGGGAPPTTAWAVLDVELAGAVVEVEEPVPWADEVMTAPAAPR